MHNILTIIKKIPAVAANILNEIALLIKDIKINIYCIDGRSRHGDELVIYYIGKCEPTYYILDKFFEGVPNVKIERSIYLPQIKGELKAIEKRAHLIFVRLHKWLFFSLGRNWIYMPEYIRQVLFLKDCDNQPEKAWKSRSVKDDLSTIRKYGYTYEVSKEPDDVDYFYHRMYIPFSKNRHREGPIQSSIETAYESGSGGILFIKRDNERVAGLTFQRRNTTIVARMIGVLDGKNELFKQSVIGAVYYFLIKYAKECGYEKIDFDYATPILTDGILRYKNKWGMRVECNRWDNLRLGLRLSDFNESAKKVLCDNPMMIISDGRLGACVFSKNNNSGDKIAGTDIPAKVDYFKGLEFIKNVVFN